jgi:8-oxo-dGTP pyrophosphatase MutT (NUDIX family)
MPTDHPPGPVVPRPAATVILVRDAPEPRPGRSPLQVFLQRRVAGMAFAGGMTVFPGGAVDPTDLPDPSAWSGPDPRWFGERFGCDPELAGSLVCAAVRETFEECGLLLAAPVPDSRPAGDLTAERAAVIAGELRIGDLLRGLGMAVSPRLLTPWAHWVTPPGQPRRFDTRFFLSGLVGDAEPQFLGGEAAWAGWMPVAEAVRGFEARELAMLPPTISCLQRIAAAHAELGGLTAVFASRPRIVRVALDELPPGVRT